MIFIFKGIFQVVGAEKSILRWENLGKDETLLQYFHIVWVPYPT